MQGSSQRTAHASQSQFSRFTQASTTTFLEFSGVQFLFVFRFTHPNQEYRGCYNLLANLKSETFVGFVTYV